MVTETSLWGWKCLPSASSRQSCHSFQCLLNICDTNNTFLEPLWTLRVLVGWWTTHHLQSDSNVGQQHCCSALTVKSCKLSRRNYNTHPRKDLPADLHLGMAYVFFTLCCEVCPLGFRTCFSIVWRFWCCCSLVCQMCQADLISYRTSESSYLLWVNKVDFFKT